MDMEEKKVVKWNELSPKQQNEFTMDNSIRKFDNYIDYDYDMSDNPVPIFWSKDKIDGCIKKVQSREMGGYGITDMDLYKCLTKYPIKNKSVAIIGSQSPWYESICLGFGGVPTTIEYNKLKTDDDRLTLMTVEEYDRNPIKFDAVISISSIEHDGLGRYGDPINPDGDIETMKKIKNKILKKDGLIFLAVPIGVDTLCWNAHRVYGEKRWPKLIEEFQVLYSPGFGRGGLDECFGKDMGKEAWQQPVVVLQ